MFEMYNLTKTNVLQYIQHDLAKLSDQAQKKTGCTYRRMYGGITCLKTLANDRHKYRMGYGAPSSEVG